MRLDAEDLMEDRRLNVNKPKNSNNGSIIGISIAIIITILIICVLFVIKQTIEPQSAGLQVYVDGAEANINKNIFVFEDNKIYVSVKGIASYVGYEVHSGEFKIEAEDVNKVFVENKQETASMFLNSAIISKTIPNLNDEYKDYEMSEPARQIDGEIYVISDGIEIACNITIEYDSAKKRMDINTVNYYYEVYNKAIQDNGFKQLSDNFENKKAILYDRLVVENEDGKYGVLNSKGEEVIGTRYKYIQFDEYNQEFTITNNNEKVGIDYINGETKINIKYDEIKSIDKNEGLYLIKTNDKYGVINNNERIIIHAEYDEIGIDIEQFGVTTQTTTTSSSRNSKDKEEQADPIKQYVFFATLIPVKQNDKWGFFNVKGEKLTEMKYTGIGCVAKEEVEDKNNKNNKNNTETNKKQTGNILLIDDYDLMIVENNKKYGLIESNAKEVLAPNAVTDMYSITNEGVKAYYMELNGKNYNMEKLFLQLNLKRKTEENDTEDNNTEDNNQESANEIQENVVNETQPTTNNETENIQNET